MLHLEMVAFACDVGSRRSQKSGALWVKLGSETVTLQASVCKTN